MTAGVRIGGEQEKGRSDWETPPWLFDRLHREFRFDVDAAASAGNAKLPLFWTLLEDAAVKQLILGDEPLELATEGGRFRWWLRRRWARWGGGEVCWIMLNPSTANATHDDPTLHRCIHFTRAWGYSGLVVVNLYPLRSSNPEDCRRWADYEKHGPDWTTRDRLMENADLVARTAKRAGLVVAAWGAAPWANDWAEHVADEMITGGPAPWPDIYCIGQTAGGAPKHPLARGRHRVPNDQRPVLWKAGDPIPVMPLRLGLPRATGSS